MIFYLFKKQLLAIVLIPLGIEYLKKSKQNTPQLPL